jgi:UDP-glucose 4-epimerase
VADTVTAMCALMTRPEAKGEVFNVGQPREVTMDALAQRIVELTGSASRIVHVPYDQVYARGFEDMRRRVPDVSKLRQYTGFAPQTSLDEALTRIIAHARESES